MTQKSLDQNIIAQLNAGITSSGGEKLAVKTPFTGEEIYQIPLSTEADVDRAFDAAKLAQVSWSATSFTHRRRILLKGHDLLLQRSELLQDIVQLETGKARTQAFEEVFIGAAVTRYNAVKARQVLRTRRRRGGIPVLIGTEVSYHPKGTVGVITPWNYPLSLGLFDTIPALAAGNALVQKVDSQAPFSVLAARAAFIDAGLPPQLWQIVTGPGSTIGSRVVGKADSVSFTGSTRTGITVAKQAAENLVSASLELGGKNALLVLEDADIQQAAKQASYACFASMGQLCVSMERIYVMNSVYEEFQREFIAAVESLRLGSALDLSCDLGSLASQDQLDQVQSHVDDAVKKGATVLTGGKALPELGPYFYAPTVLTDLPDDALACREETFGPVVALSPVGSATEALLLINDTEYGLNASIFTGDPARGKRLGRALKAGSVNINEGFRASFASVDAPMGGFKKSGLGRRNGPEGLLRFTDAQTLSVRRRILGLPVKSTQFVVLIPVMLLLLRVLKLIRRG